MHGLAGCEHFLGSPCDSRQVAAIDIGSCIWSAVSDIPFHIILNSKYFRVLKKVRDTT